MESVGLFKLAELRGSWLAARHAAVASNVANLDTPGHRAVDVEPFSSVLTQLNGLSATRTDAGHSVGSMIGAVGARDVEPKWGVKYSGNSVSVEQELIKGQEIRSAFALNSSITRAFHNMLLSATRG